MLEVENVVKRLNQIVHACRLTIDDNEQKCIYNFYDNDSNFYMQKIYNNEQSLIDYKKRIQARRLKELSNKNSNSC